MPQKTLGSVVVALCAEACLVQAKEFCFGVNNEQYRCEMGYCCGETECCTYYYELWWFWLVWTLIIMLSCCCAYRHRRVKMRLQQEQRQREISLMAYQGASSSFISPPPLNLRLWNDCKLPDYEEVVGHPPTPPPPYSENPPDVAPPPSAAQVVSPQSQVNSEAEGTGGTEPSAPVLDEEAEPMPVQAQCLPVESGEEEEDEELNTRRRHVTGDSGIEVCVCQVDADEDSDEEHRMCMATSGDYCSARQQQPFIPKEHPAEVPGQNANTSTGDHMV
ncbi:WW domain-binding protein 1 [Periophthalmus magnuspinnatus]|uniref:WW domain-binding protein 1 n=1 Tax=Periophthalmus magnuspinnatus TaxID=409849 RepID=UPI00145BF38F|nr:WW domain-binding protein 1 [Periophthalmus magnuspinnatus]